MFEREFLRKKKNILWGFLKLMSIYLSRVSKNNNEKSTPPEAIDILFPKATRLSSLAPVNVDFFSLICLIVCRIIVINTLQSGLVTSSNVCSLYIFVIENTKYNKYKSVCISLLISVLSISSSQFIDFLLLLQMIGLITPLFPPFPHFLSPTLRMLVIKNEQQTNDRTIKELLALTISSLTRPDAFLTVHLTHWCTQFLCNCAEKFQIKKGKSF